MNDAHWLVKDFDILYRSALDVSESIIDPHRAASSRAPDRPRTPRSHA